MPQDEKTRSAETSADFTSRDEPLDLFAEWFREAKAGEPSDPNAMSLATVDASGMPNVRMVLLKGFDHRGFVFYTNLESAEGAPSSPVRPRPPLASTGSPCAARFASVAPSRP